MERKDDFGERRRHLASLSDEELEQRFWDLAHEVVRPLVELARTHTSPAIERSVLLRMGFSSPEADGIVRRCGEQGILGRGAGRIVLELALAHGLQVRDAGRAFLQGEVRPHAGRTQG